MRPRRVFGWETAGGAEQHFRIDLPWTAINRERFELHRGGEAALRNMYRDGALDVVFAHRLAGVYPLWHEICDDPDVLTIYDMDDDILCVDPSNIIPYAVFHPLEPETRRNVEHADIVTVSSLGLLARYAEIHKRVAMLPMVIPDWLPLLAFPSAYHDPAPAIGWAGSMHKAQDWAHDDIAGKLAEFAAFQPYARFETIGGNYTRGLPPGRHHHQPFTTLEHYYKSINFNIGLAPLMPSPFNEGKTITKLIEYGARGVPTIASRMGDYPTWIEHGVNGYLIDKPDDWIPFLLHLADDMRLRLDLGHAAWRKSQEYVISKQVHHWERVFGGEV